MKQGPKRRVEDSARLGGGGTVKVPAAWRGNCLCGKWLVVLRSFTKKSPITCECGRAWFIDGDEAKFNHQPLNALKMGGAAQRTEEAMRSLAAVLKEQLPPTMGFTVFVFDYAKGGTMSYLSTATREDMVGMIRQWLAKASL